MRNLFLSILIIILIQNIYPQENKIFSVSRDSIVYKLDQVTVTATRYPESTMEVPYAITIISADELKNLKGYGLDEILSTIPGVFSQSRAGNQDVRIVIRGFGARGAGDRSNSGTTRGIRILLDGIPETEPDGRTAFDHFDLSYAENLEVIRSNASALWGNAAGGIINLSTVPEFNDSFIRLKGYSGSFGFNKSTLQLGSRIGNGSIYGAFSNTNYDGWRIHSASTRFDFNIGLISNLSETTALKVFLTGSSNVFHVPGPISDSLYNVNPDASNSTYEQRDERRFNRLGRVGVKVDHSFNSNNDISAMVFVNPKYLQRSERGTFRDFTRYHLGGNFIYKNNVKFSKSVNNMLVTGIDEAYQDGAILFYSLSPTNFRGSELRTNKREGAENFGAFVQDEIIINNKFSLIAGGRYDNITYNSEDYLAPEFGLQKKTFEKFTPKAGITYRFTPLQSIYFNLGGGVEVPAGNETDPAGTYGLDTVYLLNPLLEPIQSTTFELGTKHIISLKNSFIKFLTYDLALYYIKIKNDIIPYRGGRFYFTAGKSSRKGAELSTEFQLNSGISLNAAVTYSLNKYDIYMVDSVHYGSPGKFADYSGNKVAGIPDIFYNAGITYSPNFLREIFLNFNITGIGDYFVDDANKITVPSYTIFNASIGLQDEIKIAGNFGIRGFLSVNNLTDKKYIGSAFINPDIVDGHPVYIEPGAPRNYALSIVIGIN